MTREEAIAVLEESKRQNEIMRDNPTTFWASHQMAEGVKNAKRRIDALDAALTALSTLQAENEKLRGELESVRAERNAAVEDVAAIIGDVEEIRRGYGVDNADADGAFAELCETYCANNGRLCYAECEKYHCKNFKWRGQKED